MWPMLKSESNLIWLRAKEYPSFDSLVELEDVVSRCIEEYLDNPPGYECEFNADRLMNAVWKYKYKFFGIAIGSLFRDRPGNHTLNIAMVKDMFWFVDPKVNDAWPGNKDTDQPYFVWR